MADLDRERAAIGEAWGIELEPFPVLFADIGSTLAFPGALESPESGEAFYQMLQQSEPNRLIRAPPTLDHRYFHEDVPYGLVPMRELGHAAGVATPVMDALITLASSLTRTDFGRTGWTLERLGLPDDRSAVQEFLLHG
jgi:opine dehydrogenase